MSLLAADPVGERAGDRRDDHRHRRPRQDPQPRLERRVALHGLEELGEQEDRAEHPERHEQRRGVRERERAVAEEAHRQHRRRRAQLPGDERGGQDARRRRASRRSPARSSRPSSPRTRPQTIPNRPALARPRPGRSNRLAGPQLSSSRSSASGTSTSPIGTFSQKIQCHEMPDDDGAADERAERDGEAADPAPRAERDAAALGRDRRREDRQRERHHDRAAEALHRARRRSSASIDGASAAAAEASGEDAEADREQPPPPEAVAERGAREQQHGEGQRVGVDRPLEARRCRRRDRCGSPGSAVVTTRLSSVTMKSATEVIANVQIHDVPCLCDSSLTSDRKKETRLISCLAAVEQPLRPRARRRRRAPSTRSR